MKKITALLTVTLALAGCGRDLDSATYTSGNTVGKVVYGTVISARQVTVKDNDSGKENALGGIAGGALGGVAGSTIGGGSGRSIATIGGVIAGAMLGSAAEGELSTSSGTEYIVQLDGSQKAAGGKTYRSNERLSVNGGKNVADDINQSIQIGDQESSAIAVVQQDAVVIAPGSRVAVIYSDDRPRITPITR